MIYVIFITLIFLHRSIMVAHSNISLNMHYTHIQLLLFITLPWWCDWNTFVLFLRELFSLSWIGFFFKYVPSWDWTLQLTWTLQGCDCGTLVGWSYFDFLPPPTPPSRAAPPHTHPQKKNIHITGKWEKESFCFPLKFCFILLFCLLIVCF